MRSGSREARRRAAPVVEITREILQTSPRFDGHDRVVATGPELGFLFRRQGRGSSGNSHERGSTHGPHRAAFPRGPARHGLESTAMAIAASKRAASCRSRFNCGVRSPRRHPATRATGSRPRSREMASASSPGPIDRVGSNAGRAHRQRVGDTDCLLRSAHRHARMRWERLFQRKGDRSRKCVAGQARFGRICARPFRCRLSARRRCSVSRSSLEWHQNGARTDRRRSTQVLYPAWLIDNSAPARSRRKSGRARSTFDMSRRARDEGLERHVVDPAPDENVPDLYGRRSAPPPARLGRAEARPRSTRRETTIPARFTCSGARASSST